MHRFSVTVFLVFATVLLLQAAVRPAATMLRVPDGAITIDGRDDDWGRLGDAFTRCRLTPDFTTNLHDINLDQGEYAGAADFFFEAWTAMDRDNFYLLARVHDQSLFHEAAANSPYEGDDLEIFIDANPPEQLFAHDRNVNCRQLILIPDYVTTTCSRHQCIWSDQPAPGVVMASRLRAWGYVLEIKVPKAIFPNWAAHPEQDRIGFDMTVNDTDTPGTDSHHGPMKYVGYLLSPGQHYLTSEHLALCTAMPECCRIHATNAAPATLSVARVLTMITGATAQEDVAVADAVLDKIGSAAAARFAAAATRSPWHHLRRAGLLMLAKRAELPAPCTEMIRALATPLPHGYALEPDLVNYALVALARRQQLPVTEEMDQRLAACANTTVRLTYAWCLGVNGDRAGVPYLLKLLGDKNLRLRLKAAIALGRLGDPRALPALHAMADSDHPYAREVANTAIAAITTVN